MSKQLYERRANTFIDFLLNLILNVGVNKTPMKNHEIHTVSGTESLKI